MQYTASFKQEMIAGLRAISAKVVEGKEKEKTFLSPEAKKLFTEEAVRLRNAFQEATHSQLALEGWLCRIQEALLEARCDSIYGLDKKKERLIYYKEHISTGEVSSKEETSHSSLSLQLLSQNILANVLAQVTTLASRGVYSVLSDVTNRLYTFWQGSDESTTTDSAVQTAQRNA